MLFPTNFLFEKKIHLEKRKYDKKCINFLLLSLGKHHGKRNIEALDDCG
jgi:hypothetical protein